jgi:uncharacterized membrane protein YgcG
MPEAYDLHEGRFLIEESSGSGGDEVFIDQPSLCPDGKVRTIICARYNPNVTETYTVQWHKVTRSTAVLPLTLPNTIALGADIYFPLITEGMELKLWPGEKLRVLRSSKTAGSTMNIKIQFIESDLPFYSYEEPLRKVVKQSQRRGSVYRSTGGISEGGGSLPGGGSGAPPSGGGSVPQPY